jgi:hypothetical protein
MFDVGALESRLELDRAPFIAGLRAARMEGQRFEREGITVNVDADTAGATAKIDRLAARDVEVKGSVDLDIGPALAKIEFLKHEVRSIGGGIGGLGPGGGGGGPITGGPGGILGGAGPLSGHGLALALGAAAPLVPTVGASAVQGALGAGALGLAGAGAGLVGGAGIFGAAAPAITQLKTSRRLRRRTTTAVLHLRQGLRPGATRAEKAPERSGRDACVSASRHGLRRPAQVALVRPDDGRSARLLRHAPRRADGSRSPAADVRPLLGALDARGPRRHRRLPLLAQLPRLPPLRRHDDRPLRPRHPPGRGGGREHRPGPGEDRRRRGARLPRPPPRLRRHDSPVGRGHPRRGRPAPHDPRLRQRLPRVARSARGHRAPAGGDLHRRPLSGAAGRRRAPGDDRHAQRLVGLGQRSPRRHQRLLRRVQRHPRDVALLGRRDRLRGAACLQADRRRDPRDRLGPQLPEGRQRLGADRPCSG